MNDLLFYALLIALLYYFFYYLPQQKKLNAEPLPLKHNQATQTEETISNDTFNYPGAIQCPSPSSQFEVDLTQIKQLEKDLQQKERTIIGLNNSYHKLETKSKKELNNLQTQINTLTHQLQSLKTNQNKEEKETKEIEKVIDSLLKNIQELNNSLE